MEIVDSQGNQQQLGLENIITTNENRNFVQRFVNKVKLHPRKLALTIAHMDAEHCINNESFTYAELAIKVVEYQQLWKKKGWQANDRVIVIIKPSSQLYAIALSMLALGIVPVFIDTGMGLSKIKMAIADANARAIISMRSLLKWFWLLPVMWRLERLSIDGSGIGSRCLHRQRIVTLVSYDDIEVCSRNSLDHGFISFTSGSTGRPKGADRTHGSLIEQHLAIREHWQDNALDIDCPCFPILVLHNLTCGLTTVMPKVDLSAPGQVDAKQVTQQLASCAVTRLSGAPAYIEALACYLNEHGKTNQQVTSLVVGGATVSASLAQHIVKAFPNANARVVYGSTEAEPISAIDIKEYLAEQQGGDGYLVGKPVPQAKVLLTRVGAILANEDALFRAKVEPGAIGEIWVTGKHVLQGYIDNIAANAENKIARQNGLVWHRTGDVGFLDDVGRLWLTGRVKDVVYIDNLSIEPYPVEQKIDRLADIRKSALISTKQGGFLFIELIIGCKPELSAKLSTEMQEAIGAILTAAGIKQINMIILDKIAVDGRHNSKIDRPELRNKLSSRRAVRKMNIVTWRCS